MPENSQINKDDLALLLDICREAGILAMRYFGHNPEVWIKPGDSPVSEADLAVDHLLKDRLLRARPDYGWISEETADERAPRHYKRTFVVDPIDGTRGFLEGSAFWCISIAIIENGRPQVGVLQCPVKKDVYAAIAGEGATLNGQPIKSLNDTVDGIQVVSATRPMEKKLTVQAHSQFSFANYISSLAYRIVLLAVGDIDIVLVRPGCHDWDIAAADLILQECGGMLVDDECARVSYGKGDYTQSFLIAAQNSQMKYVLDIVHAAKLV